MNTIDSHVVLDVLDSVFISVGAVEALFLTAAVLAFIFVKEK